METEKKVHWPRLIIITLVVILGMAAIGIGVWYYMDKQATETEAAKDKEIQDLQKQINELNKTQSINNNSVTSTTQTATNNIYKITGLGIKLTLDSSISDLYNTAPTSGSVNFSTKRLDSYGEYCIASQSPLGILEVSTEGPLDSADPNYSPNRSIGALVKQLGTKYVYFMGPQAPCSDNKTAQSLQTSQLTALRSSLQSVSLIQ